MIPLNTGKSLIPLSIGDPTVFGNLLPPATAIDALGKLVTDCKSNGYAPSTGITAAREAIVQRYSRNPAHPITANDVMICSGASGALHIAMDALLGAGDNILLPKPGFSLYATIAGYLNVEVRYYNLLPDRNWECDLAQMATLVNARTRAILINNPSNPNGSNFSRSHLLEIIEFARKAKLPLLSDEIYADMVFAGETFYPLASLSDDVPVIEIGGIAKQYVVPGWRIGWIVFHDRGGKLKDVQAGALRLTQVILGANTLCQALVPNLLLHTPASYYTTLNSTLAAQALFLSDQIRLIPGLQPIKPQGAMYLMVRILTEEFPEALNDDVKFSSGLLVEEMLFVLPGSCFLANNFIRLVTCAPRAILEQAVQRLRSFCERHHVNKGKGVEQIKPGGSPVAAVANGAVNGTAAATSPASIKETMEKQ